ncbi:DUF6888 family protein, partial [Fortiea sp. LEGE XX443]|uniref:DUF6888 family protein n=1 Tax=Fortiea sp. LEGE XX443 TaxID=1828611 RepID=UPI001D14229C
IPKTIFIHKFDGLFGWTRLYHALCLRSGLFTSLYYRDSDTTGLVTTDRRTGDLIIIAGEEIEVSVSPEGKVNYESTEAEF